MTICSCDISTRCGQEAREGKGRGGEVFSEAATKKLVHHCGTRRAKTEQSRQAIAPKWSWSHRAQRKAGADCNLTFNDEAQGNWVSNAVRGSGMKARQRSPG